MLGIRLSSSRNKLSRSPIISGTPADHGIAELVFTGAEWKRGDLCRIVRRRNEIFEGESRDKSRAGFAQPPAEIRRITSEEFRNSDYPANGNQRREIVKKPREKLLTRRDLLCNLGTRRPFVVPACDPEIRDGTAFDNTGL